MGVIGSIFSGIFGSHAATSAANAQVDAANHAADLQHQDAQAALDFNKQQYGNSLNLLSPYYNTGTASLNRLGFLMGLSPQTGLPGGVVNPNAPATSGAGFGGGGGTAFNRFNFMPTLPGGGTRQPVQDGASIGNGGGGFSATSGFVPRNGMGFDGNGLINGGINPGNANPGNATAQPGPLQNPDAHNFDAGNPAAGTSGGLMTGNGATVADGTPGMVPRTDGGGDPNNPTAPVPGGGFGSLASNFGQTWTPPTGVTEANDPGYQFRINQGLQALQNSAAAKGTLFGGDTAKGLNDYAQNSASGEFQNVYNRSLNDYTTRYNAFNQDQNTQFNRFAALAGLGQTSAGQLSSAGLSTAGLNANTLLTSGDQIGRDYLAAGNARGSGYINSANAINGAIGNGSSNIAQLLALMGGA